ncbi:jun dimerization protein 2-like [Lepus europaeus]|uniref:jun dimerization protein 2-like n=1 Tax=Lepus europaeus TaxID=9983 RepID=UPI002B4663C8|nr:jun dimerization protein 2-like [Lepus europaeus]XP_062055297.1 jun dimerization protein 2-like [Lepus europaeus]XP_062069519.1 jun dimerization protein 2-like [Lepus europaeus]
MISDPFVTTSSLPGQDPLTGRPGSALIVKELKCIGTIIVPLLEIKLGMPDAAVDISTEVTTKDLRKKEVVKKAEHEKDEVNLDKRPQPVKSKLDEQEERRKRRLEQNKAVWARRKERTETLQREFERLEFRNAVLKIQVRELEQERQQLILVLNRRRPTCIVRTDSVPTPWI